jgi:hypothetical protein
MVIASMLMLPPSGGSTRSSVSEWYPWHGGAGDPVCCINWLSLCKWSQQESYGC